MQTTRRGDRHPDPPRLARPAGPIRGRRILYVDDESLLRQGTARMLRAAGATSLLAETHDQAVAFAAGDPAPALAIIDFHMPDGPVDALLERLRAANPSLPLIGTSGQDREREFCDLGVIRFLAKPWELADLERLAASMLPSRPPVPVALSLDSGVADRPLSD